MQKNTQQERTVVTKKREKKRIRVICDYSPFYKYYFYDDDDLLGE